MTPKELREKKPEELEDLEKQFRVERDALALQHRMGQLKDTSRLTKMKKDIARILTIRGVKNG
ncbi:MAG: 50S ribosomal protein L29 [Deltaproteobacteria bacterium]|nr:50S ribosomal protein L29 [Deltaproteobacteria bacterium]